MCGMISRHAQSGQHAVDAMSGSLAHRGPDSEGKFNSLNLAMSMRRLSIIDLNSSWQPLYNADRSIAIIANGEIYNYVELRHELQNADILSVLKVISKRSCIYTETADRTV